LLRQSRRPSNAPDFNKTLVVIEDILSHKKASLKDTCLKRHNFDFVPPPNRPRDVEKSAFDEIVDEGLLSAVIQISGETLGLRSGYCPPVRAGDCIV
jgi:hypothetical protein